MLNTLDQICRTGFLPNQDMIKQKLIYTSNAICLLSFFVCSIMTILKFLFVGNFFETLATFLAGCSMLTFIWFNKARYFLAGRVLMLILANLILLAISIIFTHDSFLDIYFLFICNTTLQMFDYRERRWAYFVTGFSIFCLLIETTFLQKYLPAYNLIPAEDIPEMNVVLIVGIMIFAIVQARIFVIVSRFKEAYIAATQNTLKSSQDDLKTQQEDLEAFGVAVTHDLKAPISIAHLYLNLINRHVKNRYASDSDLNEFVETVHKSLSQMEKLILAYLSFNKVKNQSLNKEIFNVQEELDQIVQGVLNGYGKADVICQNHQISIHTNRYLFNTIMKNLIENGLKHNLSEKPVVRVVAEQKPNYTVFLITDNGMGIDDKFAKFLFMPFKRFNTRVEGTGLGLAVAKRAAHQLEGNLSCRKTDEKGTTFALEIPV